MDRSSWAEVLARSLLSPLGRRWSHAQADGESHFVWGRRLRLRVIERPGRCHVEADGDRLLLYTSPETTAEKRRKALDEWYRQQLREAIPGLIAKWEPTIGVTVPKWSIRRMKTKWGSCNRETGHIWFNNELAKKHPDTVEYIVVHEMAHLRERSHGEAFVSLMDDVLPGWRTRRDLLNGSPLAHEEWRQ